MAIARIFEARFLIMVSTRHHPKTFPPPAEPTSPATASRRVPQTPTSTSSSRDQPSPPPPSTRRATSRKRRSAVPKTEEEEIEQIIKESAKEVEEASSTAITTRTQARSPSSTATKSRSKSHVPKSHSAYEHTPAPFAILWLLISIPLVIWDTGYVFSRPYSMPGGGKIHDYFFKPYEFYGTVDYFYGRPSWDEKDGFTGAQSALNVIETLLYGYYLLIMGKRVVGGDGFLRGVALKSLNIFARYDQQNRAKFVVLGGSDVALAVVLCFTACVMTASKTILYAANEAFSGFRHLGHNDFVKAVLFWLPLNGAWIIVPAYMSYILGKEIVEAMSTDKGGRKSRRGVGDD